MDYSKSGNPKPDKNTPRSPARETPGERKAKASAAEAKAQMLARMKAAAEARKKD